MSTKGEDRPTSASGETVDASAGTETGTGPSAGAGASAGGPGLPSDTLNPHVPTGVLRDLRQQMGADSARVGLPSDELNHVLSALHEHPKQIGPYRILSVIAQGGMGVVYKAERDKPVRQIVALKMI